MSDQETNLPTIKMGVFEFAILNKPSDKVDMQDQLDEYLYTLYEQAGQAGEHTEINGNQLRALMLPAIAMSGALMRT